MDRENKIYMSYWGKAARESEVPNKHFLIYHLLDVAAVGREVLTRHPSLLNRLSDLAGLSTDLLERWLVWLLAHHDFGKLAAGFQRLRPDLCPGPVSDRYRYDTRHDTLGYLLFKEKLLDEVFPFLGGRYELEDAVLLLLQASSGHHGKPPDDIEWRTKWFREEDVEAARVLSRDLSHRFFDRELPTALEPDDPTDFERRMAAASWPMAGFAVLCDWIGSNRTWFRFVDEPMSLEQYWRRHALPKAYEAVGQAAVVPVQPSAFTGFRDLFTGISEPTGLQRATEDIPLADGPQLFLIEDLTGSGKTEAALTLVGRILSAGKGEGLFVALPTTATADAMFDRVGRVYRKLFKPKTSPSLVLAHSRRDLSEKFSTSVVGDRVEPEECYGDGEAGAAATCAAWLADNRKKALLAQVGVGTIDQALLAVLNVRHQSLRAYGLLGKVLVVDEVHACDAYMNRVLERLLNLHAVMGGSAVLLSATLPLETRRRLAGAFGEGAGFLPPGELPAGYPQLLGVSAEGISSREVAAPPWAEKTLGFELRHDPESAVDWVAEQAEGGACVCWIRNTVGDAVEARDRLAERLGPDLVTLFHARFALGDRLGIEREVVDRFGKGSGAEERTGRVVVATQVVEQSLDLDFDEMLSDLAPIDLLIQRAGRLRRHLRDRDGNPLRDGGGADGRGEPVLHVLAPETGEEPGERWVRDFLPGTAAVYDHHGHLWLTLKYIEENPQIQLPRESRDVIDAVFGAEAQDRIPAGLDRGVIEVEGRRRADASLAGWNTINAEAGYGGGFGSWTDKEDGRTRLGEPTVTLRLARWDGERYLPLVEDGLKPWALSEVSVRRSLVDEVETPDDPAAAEAFRELEESFGDRPSWFKLVPLCEETTGSWGCSAHDADRSHIHIRYSRTRGLEAER